MNRKDRRKIGFTESRYRKIDMQGQGINYAHRLIDPFFSHSQLEAYKLGNTNQQRRQRLIGQPRNWLMERSRRKLQQLQRLEEELGINDYS